MKRKTICICANDTYNKKYDCDKKLYFWECVNCGKKKYIYKRTTKLKKKLLHNSFYYVCKLCNGGAKEKDIVSDNFKCCPYCGKRIINYIK